MDVQDSTRADTALVISPVPWLNTLGYTVQRNFFATSHAKGEQDAADSQLKQKTTAAVLHRRVKLRSAQELCDSLTETFSEPAESPFPSRQKSVQLKRLVFFNLASSGGLAVFRNREGGRFCTVKGIRQLHSVRICSEQLKIFTRERACYCHHYLAGRYNRCKNMEWVDNWKEVMKRWQQLVLPGTVYIIFVVP